jgi:hypothetical protein
MLRLDFTRSDGTKVECEDLRAWCAALSRDDGYPGDYSYATIDRSPDGGQSVAIRRSLASMR